mgnify:CR=1 FL=1
MLSMTSSDAATSAHCVVMAQSLRHRKPWIFNASKGSSRSAKSPRAEVRPPLLLLFVVEIVEIVEDTNGVVVVLAVIFWRPSRYHERNKRTYWVVQRERETEDTKSTPIKWGMISNERKNPLFFSKQKTLNSTLYYTSNVFEKKSKSVISFFICHV